LLLAVFNREQIVIDEALTFINAVIAILNFLYGIRAPVRLPTASTLTAAQSDVVKRISRACKELAIRLSSAPPSFKSCSEAWAAFHQPNANTSVPLNAKLVDNLVKAGTCDPAQLLPNDIAALVSTPVALFPQAPTALNKFASFYSGQRSEYVQLVIAQLRCGKLSLAGDVRAGGSVFAIEKSGGSRQREVWNGSRVSRAAADPPRPRHLASPSAFKAFDLAPGKRLRVTKRDGKCFFDQLLLPTELRKYMGRPWITRAELAAGGVAHDEMNMYIEAGTDPMQEKLWPVSCVWCMGFSWSSFIAQETLLSVLQQAGLGPEKIISTDGPSPLTFLEAVGLATDDVMIFSDAGEGGTTNATKRLEAAFLCNGIVKHDQKDVNDATSATCVGVELVDGTHWWPPASKMWHLIYAAIYLATERRASWVSVLAFQGTLQWFDLLQRLKLSMYQEVYGFAKRQPEWDVVDVPTDVLIELVCGVGLAPYWAFDMTVPHLPFLGATDASIEFGYGACVARMGVNKLREIARLDSKVGDHVELGANMDVGSFTPRLGRPHHLGLSLSDFHVVLCLKVVDDEHINLREGRAFIAYLRWILRAWSRHGHRVVVLVDSKVWLGAAAKGRSSSWSLNCLLRRVAALVMAAGLQLHLIFVPSAHNPSDPPSRGRRPRCEARERRFRPEPQRLQRLQEWLRKMEEPLPYLSHWT
jgi:hypothetical protein